MIRYRTGELLSLAEYVKIFCLSNGNLAIEQQALTFEEARVPIQRAVRRHEARSTRSTRADVLSRNGHDRQVWRMRSARSSLCNRGLARNDSFCWSHT
jgi:hypothetical protein